MQIKTNNIFLPLPVFLESQPYKLFWDIQIKQSSRWFINILMSQKLETCYEQCNSKYSAMSPSRLFCKKGCDSDEQKIAACKDQTCNKLCIKSNQGQQKLWFQFLLRAPEKPDVCLEACIYGCNRNRSYLD